MACRGIRGATTVETNDAQAVVAATEELLEALILANDIDPSDLASAIFTVTDDLDAAFPAQAARRIGWTDVALLDSKEIPVPGSLARCIRVLLHWNTEKRQEQVCHVYLRRAQSLRPDLRRL